MMQFLTCFHPRQFVNKNQNVLRIEVAPLPRIKLRVSQSSQPDINAATRLCAVLGRPIAHSASPAMHNAAFEALGLNWRYLAFEVDPKNLRAAIEGARAMNFAGLNLTVPHKLLAVEMMDQLDDSAKMFGAVNTIKFEAASGKRPRRRL